MDIDTLFREWGPWAAAAGAWVWLVHRWIASTQDTRSFERARTWLREDSINAAYFRLLSILLLVITNWVGDAERLKQRPASGSGALLRRFGPNPWTPESYTACLFLAVFYPLLGLMAFWALMGSSGVLGDWELLPPAAVWQRLTLAGVIAIATYSLYRIGRLADRASARGLSSRRKVLRMLPYVLAGVLAYATPIAVARVLFGAGTGAGAVTTTLLLLLIYRFLAKGDRLLFTTLIYTVVISIALQRTSAIAAIAVWSAPIIIAGIDTIFRLTRQEGVANALISLLMAAVLLTALYRVPGFGNAKDSVTGISLVLVILLPLSNAPLDWLSLGVTRGLLHAIHEQRHRAAVGVLWSLFDVLLALALLVLVSAATVALVALANRMTVSGGGTPLVDLDAVFTGIAADPLNPAYYWLYLLLGTTLLPTVLHAFVAALALVSWIGQIPFLARWRTQAAEHLHHDIHMRWAATAYFAAVPPAGLFLAGGLVWLMVLVLTSEPVLAALIPALQVLAGWVQA